MIQIKAQKLMFSTLVQMGYTAFLPGHGVSIFKECTQITVYSAMCLLAGEFRSFIVLKFGDFRSAKEMYMRLNHWIDPSEVKMSLLDCALSAGETLFALHVCENMMADRQLADPAVAGCLIMLLAPGDMVDKVIRIYDDIKLHILSIDTVGVDSLVQCFVKKEINENIIHSLCDLHRSPSMVLQKTKRQFASHIAWDRMLGNSNVIPTAGISDEIMTSLLAAHSMTRRGTCSSTL